MLYSSTANQIKIVKESIILPVLYSYFMNENIVGVLVSKNCTPHGNNIFFHVCWGGG